MEANKTHAGESSNLRAYVVLAAGLLILGISAILVKLANAPGPVSGFYRMGIGWVALTVPFLLRRNARRISKKGLLWAALAGLFFGLDMTFWTTGIMLAGPTKPTLMANTTPLWVGLGAMALYQEKLKAKFWIGLVIALTGALVIVGVASFQDAGLGLGSIFGLVSAFFYSSFFLSAQRGREETDSLSFVWVSTLVSTLVLLGASLILKHPLTGYNSQTILIFVVMGIVVQAVGWLLISYVQGHLPASIVSPTLLGQPVLTAIFAVPLFGEVFTWVELVGGIAVLGGVYLVHLGKSSK